MPYFLTYQKNHKATDPFKSTVIDIDIIRNFFPTPLFVKPVLFINNFIESYILLKIFKLKTIINKFIKIIANI